MRNVGKIMIAVAVAVGLSACAPSEQASTKPSSGPSTPAPAKTTTTSKAAAATGPECTADDIKVTGELNAKPSITVPTTCAPPKGLVIKDLVKGTGKEVVKGGNMLTHYLLVTWSDKVEKDSSWKGNKPFPLQNVGEAGVIDGWNQGLIGIKQGGRRLLVVPPELGYGDGGGRMTPNETLVFVIDAVQVA
jgi:peptidylprolyl isomerase